MLCALTAIAAAQKPQPIQPLVHINTTWSQPVGGTTWAAHTAAQLSSALTASVPGDIIVLDAGVTYSGNFTIPAKSNPNKKWIYVISSKLSSMPAGTRVSPASSANMPKIVTPGASSAITFKDGANRWRFAGIEIRSASTYRPSGYTPGVFYGYALIDKYTYPSVTLPDSITFDRCYIHGDSTHDVQRGISGNASNYAVIDSYISEIHMKGVDTQAFGAWESPGPFKIANTHLEAAGENLMFGGSGGASNRYIPSDIEATGNYLVKPLSWVPLTVAPINQWVEKNAFEVKSGQRILFDSNVIENVWYAAQTGFAVLLTVRTSQSGDIAVVNDVTITNNILKNVVGGFVGLAKDDQCGTSSYPSCKNAGSQDRWVIADNLITFYNPALQGGGRNAGFSITPGLDRIKGTTGGLRDTVIQHNTLVSAASTSCWASIYFSVPSGVKPPLSNLTSNLWILDNEFCKEPTGDYGEVGTTGLTQYIGSPASPYDITHRLYGNVMYFAPGIAVPAFPPHNYATTVPIGYVSPPTGNYQLVTPNWTDTSDGQLAGINFSKLPSKTGP